MSFCKIDLKATKKKKREEKSFSITELKLNRTLKPQLSAYLLRKTEISRDDIFLMVTTLR